MLIIIDDVLDEERRNAVVGYFSESEEARSMKWEPSGVEELKTNESPMALLLKEAAKYFDLSSMVGSEYWAHYGTHPGWHVDRDEKLALATGDIKHPICSIVYYAKIESLAGGKFLTKTETITPKTNRMIMFSPGMEHSVEYYMGTRLSVAVNPWQTKPIGY
jgi:hypothetical protein